MGGHTVTSRRVFYESLFFFSSAESIHRQGTQALRQNPDQLPATDRGAEAEARVVRRLQGSTLFAAKGKGGKGGSAQAGRPPAAMYAHSAQSTGFEQQLDEGLEWLEKMRGEFGNATTE